ncbi:cell wall hydrolase/autolysin [Bacillus anthracis]|nr:N-acetylmuramoyl-L-alanine amidase AmiB [Bacillus anthracis]GAO62707.1 cell wall hydrolase/autolysin [Bacillus anthracis]
MPSVLTELGFVDNKADGKKLDSPEWRQRAAEAIYAGILDYYEWKGHNMSAYY